MAMFFLVLLLLFFSLVGRISAGGLEQSPANPTDCGLLGKGRYGVLSDGFVRFLAERDSVGRDLICDSLKLWITRGCDVDGERRKIWADYCSFGSSASSAAGFDSLKEKQIVYVGDIHHQIFGERVALEQSGLVGSKHGRERYREDNGKHESSVSSKRTVVALPAAFLLCCAFLCPCFQKKERDNKADEFPLNNTRLGQHSTSSEFLRHYGRSPDSSQRMPGSPQRMVGSPIRSPPHSHRLPLGPSRFATTDPMQIKFEQISKATQKFSTSHLIGEGGFGKVYKAELPNGVVVAVKRANKEHFSLLHEEFKNEVNFLSQIEHQGLVRLLGYLEERNERIIISEYVPNGSLREHLNGCDGRVLDFSQRLSIAIDVAHALTYLHSYAEERPIIHRDVKSSNVLLTENLRAKVADFGFAKVGSSAEEQSHIMTAVKGTAGYTDPEYLRTFQLTPKSDVFSFGALLVEIISGRRPIEAQRPFEERITLRWAFDLDKRGRARDILDPKIEEAVNGDSLSSLLQLAFDCAAPTRNDRPTMREAVKRLWDIRRGYGRTHNSTSLP